mgnify:CR=1 FL=1
MKICFRQKMIRILSRTFLESCEFYILQNWGQKYINYFLVNLLKFESDTATLNNIAIIKL